MRHAKVTLRGARAHVTGHMYASLLTDLKLAEPEGGPPELPADMARSG